MGSLLVHFNIYSELSEQTHAHLDPTCPRDLMHEH